MSDPSRLAQQIDFIVEIDKLKRVFRQTWLMDQSRKENDAEHSWHLAVMVILLQEHAKEQGLDLLRVLKMVLIHDLVEIDAGDTFVYDAVGALDKAQREQRAADRIFNLLPADQAAELRRLWDEFESRSTPESRYAAALDRLQPILHNYFTEGRAWREHGVTSEMVTARNRHIAEGSPALWEFVEGLIRDAVAKGYLAR
jgi:putative hydrolase of HD superfamily